MFRKKNARRKEKTRETKALTAPRQKADRIFFGITITLTLFGFFMFASASLGLLAREGVRFSAVAFNQAFFGLFLGSIAGFSMMRLDYRLLRQYALHIFLSSIILTALVLIPGVGYKTGGARRWLLLGPLSFQPAELFKIAFIIYFAGWLAASKEKIGTFAYGAIPLLIMLGISGAILLAQPDTSTFLIVAAAGGALFIAGNGRWQHLLLICLLGVVSIGVLVAFKPYLQERIMTFIDPARDPLGTGYQMQQALIAVGSGGAFGRGFGQSVQKFNFLPEPIGDSIFAVAAEEFGLVGSLILIALFVAFTYRGFSIAARVPDRFGGLLVVGIVILIAGQSLLNIASLVGIVPLTGMPLIFVSHGGTALFFTLVEAGIVLNVSRYADAKRPPRAWRFFGRVRKL